jgi:hypothetical protein
MIVGFCFGRFSVEGGKCMEYILILHEYLVLFFVHTWDTDVTIITISILSTIRIQGQKTGWMDEKGTEGMAYQSVYNINGY